jgi:chromosome partitioning protein
MAMSPQMVEAAASHFRQGEGKRWRAHAPGGVRWRDARPLMRHRGARTANNPARAEQTEVASTGNPGFAVGSRLGCVRLRINLSLRFSIRFKEVEHSSSNKAPVPNAHEERMSDYLNIRRRRSGPHVVVIGNHKGGSGKTTVAMQLIVALIKEGRRVASVDLDLKQQTLTHYMTNRRQWARTSGFPLPMPTHVSVADLPDPSPLWGEVADVTFFTTALGELQSDHDFIVIDTPGGEHHLSLLAHGLADTLLTPVNDSFLDLDVIVSIDAAGGGNDPLPSRYTQAVKKATEGRRSICDRPIDWFVIRNRLSSISSRNRQQVSDVLEAVAPKVGFTIAPGLTERVVFREFFPFGLSAFDPLEEARLGVRPSMSHLMARTEVRRMLAAIGLIGAERRLPDRERMLELVAPTAPELRRDRTFGKAPARSERAPPISPVSIID